MVEPVNIDDYRLKDPIGRETLKSGGGDGTSGGMEARVSALEKRFDRFEQKLDALVKDIAEMKGRINAMPTTWQLLGMILAIMGASFAIVRSALPVSRFADDARPI